MWKTRRKNSQRKTRKNKRGGGETDDMNKFIMNEIIANQTFRILADNRIKTIEKYLQNIDEYIHEKDRDYLIHFTPFVQV